MYVLYCVKNEICIIFNLYLLFLVVFFFTYGELGRVIIQVIGKHKFSRKFFVEISTFLLHYTILFGSSSLSILIPNWI